MAWQGNGMVKAWARHGVCESAFIHRLQHVATLNEERKAFDALTDLNKSSEVPRFEGVELM
jgi:hypothetical protein